VAMFEIWCIFYSSCYILCIFFIFFIFFARRTFEPQVHEIMNLNDSKNDIHASEGISTPYPGTDAETRLSRVRDTTGKSDFPVGSIPTEKCQRPTEKSENGFFCR
jgi:hypothetical protein